MSAPVSDQDPGDEQPPRHPTEAERVETFVQQQLRLLGFNEYQAFELVMRGVDWHDAQRLLRKGCTPEQAILILI